MGIAQNLCIFYKRPIFECVRFLLTHTLLNHFAKFINVDQIPQDLYEALQTFRLDF